MPITQGQGNPDWTYEETVLALEVLVRHGLTQPSTSHPSILDLSNLLRGSEIHPSEVKSQNFRSPGAVRIKLGNLKSCSLQDRKRLKISRVDRHVWDKFEGRETELRVEADQIRSLLGELRAEPMNGIGENETNEVDGPFLENSVSMRVHRQRERGKGLRPKLIKSRRKNSERLCCDACDCSERIALGEAAASEFEAHHRTPLATDDKARKTNISDLALLCASCHRLIHALMRVEGRILTVDELRDRLSSPPN